MDINDDRTGTCTKIQSGTSPQLSHILESILLTSYICDGKNVRSIVHGTPHGLKFLLRYYLQDICAVPHSAMEGDNFG
jgi:hypothetical protein